MAPPSTRGEGESEATENVIHMRRALLLAAVVAVASASAQSRPALRRDQASVQFMITHSMKEQLRDLGYSAAEISSLQPERAAAIIDNGIRCPSQGMPTKWNRGGGSKGGGALGKAVGSATRLVAFGLATAVGLHMSGMDLGEVSRYIDEVMRILLDSTSSSGGRRH